MRRHGAPGYSLWITEYAVKSLLSGRAEIRVTGFARVTTRTQLYRRDRSRGRGRGRGSPPSSGRAPFARNQTSSSSPDTFATRARERTVGTAEEMTPRWVSEGAAGEVRLGEEIIRRVNRASLRRSPIGETDSIVPRLRLARTRRTKLCDAPRACHPLCRIGNKT